MKRAYISLFFWVLNAILLFLYFNFRSESEELKRKNSTLERKLSRMILWSGEMGGGRKNYDREAGSNILSVVEEVARKYDIKLDSARPIEDKFEISARGVDPVSMIKFFSEIENSGVSKIIKIKIRKNFVDENMNDFEIVVAPE